MISSLDDAWHWYESTRKLAETMGRVGRKHWNDLPWSIDNPLGRDEKLRHLDAGDLVGYSHAVLDDLDDLCVLLLFSVFEAIVRDRVLADVEAELPTIRHQALASAVDQMKEGIRNNSFYNNVLRHCKGVGAGLVEEVNQVRRYRNWVAHGRRDVPPGAVDPVTARDRLQRFLDSLLGIERT
jgi:hypothetical protein